MMNSRDEIELIRCASAVPESRQDLLLEQINAVIWDNWTTTRPVWSRSESPFHPDFGLVFLRRNRATAGYAIYRRLSIDGEPAIYLAGTGVMTSHQGKGVYRAMTRAIFQAEWQDIAERNEVYYAWRTRNPVLWSSNAAYCKAVAPAIPDEREITVLQELALKMARWMYPDIPVEVPSMIMRNVYDHMTYLRRPLHSCDSPIDAWFANAIPDPVDAIFSVGIVTKASAVGSG